MTIKPQPRSNATQRTMNNDDKPRHPKTKYDDWKGRFGIWHQKLRRQGEVYVLVKILDVVERFDRIDCLILTNAGSQAWVSHKTLELVPENQLTRAGNFPTTKAKA